MPSKVLYTSMPDVGSGLLRLPVEPGAYGLFLSLQQAVKLQVGRLGMAEFASGMYAYLGSAGAPGGLRARLGRHLTGAGRQHWHVDYLRAEAEIGGYVYITTTGLSDKEQSLPIECLWSQALAILPGASIPMVGFGASDCNCGCPAHLIYLPPKLVLAELPQKISLLRYNEDTLRICDSALVRV